MGQLGSDFFQTPVLSHLKYKGKNQCHFAPKDVISYWRAAYGQNHEKSKIMRVKTIPLFKRNVFGGTVNGVVGLI